MISSLTERDPHQMDTWKFKSIQEWVVPTRVQEVQSFLGFASFYRPFMKGFSVIAQPLITLTRTDATFEWTTIAQKMFDLLKQAFTTALLLLHPEPTKPFQFETDASDFSIGAILSQPDEIGVLHPVAYYSHKFTAPVPHI